MFILQMADCKGHLRALRESGYGCNKRCDPDGQPLQSETRQGGNQYQTWPGYQKSQQVKGIIMEGVVWGEMTYTIAIIPDVILMEMILN